MANRFIIGKGELYAFDIPPPPIKPTKAHPYTLAQAKRDVIPQIQDASLVLNGLPADACPFDVAVAKLDLNPAYIAKSFFPKSILRTAGLTSIGSKTVRVKPRNDVRKNAPDECETTELFVAGTRSAFSKFVILAGNLQEGSDEALQFAEIENFSAMTAGDRLRLAGEDVKVFEVGLHLIPDQSVDSLRKTFTEYAKKCGFAVNPKYEFPVGRMLFLAIEGEKSGLETLAKFTLARVVRPMPMVRSARPVSRSTPISIGFNLPSAQPLSSEPTVAILDGGLPKQNVISDFVKRYEHSDSEAHDVDDYLEHGLAVTSAFLFGPIEPGFDASRPFSHVHHFRVLDSKSDHEDQYELYRTLGHVEEVLLSRQYQFLNLSLGPDLPYEDSDVHAWTAVIDSMLSDGETLMTVAVGNNGERDQSLSLDRIQVPADSVNAISVGASNHSTDSWARASYSARGPGRSPGRRKPDVVAFGGSPKEYFHVARPSARPELAATMGTSFAAPLALRTAVGVRAVLGDEVHPLTIKALMVHAAETFKGAEVVDIGWGRVPQDINQIITCKDGVARIIYQGMLRPGKYLRAPVPLPPEQLTGKVKLTATFCYASPVDVEDAAAYTKAGLSITFRPHSDKSSGKQIKSRSFFSASEFRTEQEQRSDLGKWETVLHASDNFLGSSLKGSVFDIHYNARDGGAVAGAGSELIRYALVLTVEAPKHVDLYDKILSAHAKLKAIEPKVSIPLRV